MSGDQQQHQQMDKSQQDREREVSFNNPNDDLFGDNEGRARSRSEEEIPRPKRIACVICRKRKLRCGGEKPACGTCTRLGHDCAYDEVRRKSGPKRGYVKALEARLAQVETLLKTKEQESNANVSRTSPIENKPPGPPVYRDPLDDVSLDKQLLSLDVDEPLPPQEVMDELHEVFFEKVFLTCPVIHKGKYLTSLGFAPRNQPPLALRYAIWTATASIMPKYKELQTHFYRKARKYAEETELKGHGENILHISSVQAWILIASYEFKLMYFPRAWMSTGRACRLAQMMGLHKVDSTAVDIKQAMPPPCDWLEREERRRTFWMAFCVDRYASIGTGWPMGIEEKDVRGPMLYQTLADESQIATCLPCSEEAFAMGRPESAPISIKEAMTPEGAALLSPFGGVILMASLFGRILLHLHRPEPDERHDDPNSTFWKRHRQMDQLLSQVSLSLPPAFRLPNGLRDGNVVFTNMNIHAATICLHQAAIFKAERLEMGATILRDSKMRCLAAAMEIANIMRMISHLELNLVKPLVDSNGYSADSPKMHPFLSFCIYVGARVFIQYLKSNPNDDNILSSLEFLTTALLQLKRQNPLTESFLMQLDIDIHGDLDNPIQGVRFPYSLRKGQPEIYSHENQVNPTQTSPTHHPHCHPNEADCTGGFLTNKLPSYTEPHLPQPSHSPNPTVAGSARGSVDPMKGCHVASFFATPSIPDHPQSVASTASANTPSADTDSSRGGSRSVAGLSPPSSSIAGLSPSDSTSAGPGTTYPPSDPIAAFANMPMSGMPENMVGLMGSPGIGMKNMGGGGGPGGQPQTPMNAAAYAQMLSEEFSSDLGMADWDSMNFDGLFLPTGQPSVEGGMVEGQVPGQAQGQPSFYGFYQM